MKLDRRDFLIKTGTLALVSAFSPSLFALETKPRFELALSQYSLRKLFKNGSLTALDFPAFAKDKFGISAIDLWEGGLLKSKLDDRQYLESIKNKCESLGVDLYLYMAGVLDTRPNKLQGSYYKIIKSLQRAKILGARYLRVFLYTEDLSEGADALTKLCNEASKSGLKIILEPLQRGKARDGLFIKKLYHYVDHPSLTLMPDFGKFRGDIYEGTQAMLPYSESISAKMHSFDAAGQQPDFDYQRLVKMIVNSDYRGYIAIEWEGKNLGPIEGVNASKKLLQDAFSKHGFKLR